MDARNNEHENLELGAIFCQADISTHSREKVGIFPSKYLAESSVIVEVVLV